MQPNDRDITISPDGTISVREGGNADAESQRGKLRLVGFDNPRPAAQGRLEHLLGAGRRAAGARHHVALRAGLASRNRTCDAVIEMTRMIEVTRTYTQVATMLQQQADLQRTAIEKLAEVPT